MQILYLSEIKDFENSYFHFSDKSHMVDNEKGPGIPKVGLSNAPRQRTNEYKGDELYPCIYFSKGFGGILELFDIWVRGNYNYRAKKLGLETGRIHVDMDVMRQEYDATIEMLENAVYLKLDLVEGEDANTSDFSSSKEDFRKREILNKKELSEDDKNLMWSYGVNSNFSTPKMDRWNMSTHFVNFKHDIPPSKITLLLASNGKDDALSILLEIYTKYRSLVNNVDDLDKFIDYVYKKKTNNKYMRVVW